MIKLFCKHCFREVTSTGECHPPAQQCDEYFKPCEVCQNRQNNEETIEFDTQNPVKSLISLDCIDVADGGTTTVLKIKVPLKNKDKLALRVHFGFMYAGVIVVFLLEETNRSENTSILLLALLIITGFVVLTVLFNRTATYIRLTPDYFGIYYGIKTRNKSISFKKIPANDIISIELHQKTYLKFNTKQKDYNYMIGGPSSETEANIIKSYIEFYYGIGQFARFKTTEDALQGSAMDPHQVEEYY